MQKSIRRNLSEHLISGEGGRGVKRGGSPQTTLLAYFIISDRPFPVSLPEILQSSVNLCSYLRYLSLQFCFFLRVILRTDPNTTGNSFAKISRRKRCPWMRTVLGWKKEFKIFTRSNGISPRAWGMSTRFLNRAIRRRWTGRRKLKQGIGVSILGIEGNKPGTVTKS